MPRIETTTRTLFKFNELEEQAQRKALENLRDIYVDFEWWEDTHGEIKELGMKCDGFDIDRGSYCNLKFVDGANEIAAKIVEEHGEGCDTHKTAKQFLADWDTLVVKHSDGVNTNVVSEENERDFDDAADDLEKEFRESLQGDYLKILRNEYEYLVSEEEIRSIIEANEYEFTENGELA